jgi:hypothetical protein
MLRLLRLFTKPEETEKAHVYFVGRIDLAMFSAISSHITTDEVIITDIQEQHVRDRHPEAYEKYRDHLEEILSEPSYIFDETKHKDTALIIKQYENPVEVVLRLCTDQSGKKNSVITFWEIKESRLRRYILTHKTLYKHE